LPTVPQPDIGLEHIILEEFQSMTNDRFGLSGLYKLTPQFDCDILPPMITVSRAERDEWNPKGRRESI
jgi:hypothetical protein